MAIIKETKYLIFDANKPVGRKTKICQIVNKSDSDELATIEWYSPWRQYCFMPNIGTVWNIDCLNEVNDAIKILMKERVREKPEGE